MRRFTGFLLKSNETHWLVLNPRGQHSIAAGVDASVAVEIEGHVGYYCAGMNKRAHVIVRGNAGQGVAENMMSGRVHVQGDASQAAGASGCGGLLIIDGNASARCGISMKGVDIIVKGSIGHHVGVHGAGWNARRVRRCRRSARRFDLRGAAVCARPVSSLGADCIEKPMEDRHSAELYASSWTPPASTGSIDVGEFAAMARRVSSIISTSIMRGPTDERCKTAESHTPPR